ncbi:CCA tRNA nucleotidyltransferase [Sphingomonas sp.]|uniref:CCA tRNA nucleotidyltransferase n=1 Tax=Sphingomonas sp. TaxID=28214 RepID=UPI003B3BA963
MILPDAPWQHQEGLDALTAALGAAAGAVRPVGGAVRDTLLGLPVADLDLATIHAPDETLRRIRAAGLKAVPTGIAHGTITAVLPGGAVEVTTLRRDVATDGRHAIVRFTDDWREDAARRDFTINALSADPRTSALFDYFDGLADLERGIVRFIGDPLTRIAEDHLRILRFFRFHARFGRGAPDTEGLAACVARANDMMALSRERVAQELLKLLAADDPVPTVRIMSAHGIFAPIVPEVSPDGVERLARLVAREGNAGDPVRRLAALLPARVDVAEAVARRLKLSNSQRRRLMLAAGEARPSNPRALAYDIGVEAARDRLLLRADDAELTDGMTAIAGWQPPRLPIAGGALISLGLRAGPSVAATLREVEARWIAEGFPDHQRVLEIARAAVDQRLRARK